MSKTHLAKVFLIATLLIVGSQAKPARGRNRAFGMGLLGGAVAGAVIGNAVAKAPQSAAKTAAPTTAPLAQIVENGVPDAHGCYKQTIKEPVAGKDKLYTETVNLICPDATAAANHQPTMMVPVQIVPVARGHAHAAAQPVVTDPAPVVQHVVAPATNSTQLNATHTHTILVHPVAPAAPGVVPASVAAPNPHSFLNVVYATPPAHVPHPAPPGTAHVILLSKTVKKHNGKNSSASVNISQGLLIMAVLYCLISK